MTDVEEFSAHLKDSKGTLHTRNFGARTRKKTLSNIFVWK